MAAKKQFPKSIYSILLITMLLLGTCLGNVQAVLGSARTLSASSYTCGGENAAIRPAGENLPIQHFLTGKNSDSQEIAVHNKRSSQKSILRLSRIISYLLFASGQPETKQRIYSYLAFNHSIPVRLSHMVIIGYIHLKDGQKSCISFLS